MGTLNIRIKRLLRHWGTSAAEGKRAFSPQTLADIGKAISAGEQTHRSELRLIVETSLSFDAIWNDVSNRQRALALFAEYRIWDTEENCGVLIYVNLADRKVDIVADRNIDRKIAPATWKAVCHTLTGGYARGEFHDSTLAAVAQVNALLHEHFPANGARANELPDAPIRL